MTKIQAMADAKHTPGPWYVTAKNAVVPHVVMGLHGEAIARCTSHDRVPDDSEHERMETNARLIAAAPELLVALQQAKDSLIAFKLMPGPHNAWEEHDEMHLAAVNSAIANATGSAQ